MDERNSLLELKGLFKNGRKLRYQKNELILRAGENARGIYLIEEGIVKIYALSRHGDEHIHHFFGPSDFFPTTWTFNNFISNLNYACCETVKVVFISNKEFNEFIIKNQKVLMELLEEVSSRYIRYAGRIENLLYSDARERCAYRLLSLANRFGQSTKDGLIIKANITHEDMAHSLNMTRETFSRALSRLQHKDIVGYDDQRHIIIKDVNSLIKFIGKDEAIQLWPKLMKN